MQFVSLGKTEAIGASCHLALIGDTGLLIDAGADPDEEGPDSLPDFAAIHQRPDWPVDHALVTHAHHDHIGSLPVLIQHFPHVRVHMTRATRDLTDFVLPASARLQQRKLEEGTSTHAPLFDEEELEGQQFLYAPRDLNTDFDVTGLRGQCRITARFYHAGHVLGAAGVLLSWEVDGRTRRAFYTSDTNRHAQAIVPGGAYPDPPVDILILESTLGADEDAESTTRKAEEKKFGDALARVLERGGTALIPSFAFGRAQEVLALIDRFKKRKRIPADIPVYTAGSMRAFAEIYDRTRFNTPRLDEEFKVFDVEQMRLPRKPALLNRALQGPAIHLAASGMMFERTLSNMLARRLVEDEKNAIFLVGFAKEDSPAAQLLAAVEEKGENAEVQLDRTKPMQPVRCEVKKFRFSGHSHRGDLIKLVERLSPATVALVHGETDARNWMADRIRKEYPNIDVVIPEEGIPVEL